MEKVPEAEMEMSGETGAADEVGTRVGPIKRVMRVQLVRGLPPRLAVGRVHAARLVLADEFHAPAVDNANWAAAGARCVRVEALAVGDFSALVREKAVQLASKASFAAGEIVVRFKLVLPAELSIGGAIRLAFHAESTATAAASNDEIILPLFTAAIEVFDLDQQQQKGMALPSLAAFRVFAQAERAVQIREEYGATIGAHIYDCSVVLMRYLDSFAELTAAKRGTVLELGAGCGLVSLWLTERFTSVLATDLAEQLPLLEANIQANGVLNCRAVCLDWSDRSGVQRFKEMHLPESESEPASGKLDLIVAGDVFYDREVSLHFIETLQDLRVPGCTVLVAQKLKRGAHETVRLGFDPTQLDTLEFVPVYREADVIVWKLR